MYNVRILVQLRQAQVSCYRNTCEEDHSTQQACFGWLPMLCPCLRPKQPPPSHFPPPYPTGNEPVGPNVGVPDFRLRIIVESAHGCSKYFTSRKRPQVWVLCHLPRQAISSTYSISDPQPHELLVTGIDETIASCMGNRWVGVPGGWARLAA